MIFRVFRFVGNVTVVDDLAREKYLDKLLRFGWKFFFVTAHERSSLLGT